MEDWSSYGIDYESLLKLIRISDNETSSESTPLLRTRNASTVFFECCGRELQRVEHFFTGKLADSMVQFSHVDAALGRLPRSSPLKNNVYTAAGFAAVPNANNELMAVDNISPSGTIVDVARLSRDIVDLHTNLESLWHYQTNNVEAFHEILQKYDRTRRCNDGCLWFRTHVRQSAFGDVDRVSELVASLQSTYAERVHNGDRRKAMASLRTARHSNSGSQWTMMRIGFFGGMFVISALFSVLCAWSEYSEHLNDWHAALQLFRGSFLVVLFISFIGVNVIGWESSDIRHALLLDLDTRDHLQARHFFEIASCLAFIWILMLLLYIVGSDLGVPPFSGPLVVLTFFVVFLLNPLRCLYFQTRRWFLRVLLRIVTAPFCRVEFADFWMADQFNSLSAVFVDLEYFICFYCHDVRWSTTNSVVSDTCNGAFRGIAGFLPAWFRFAQCLRFYYDTRLCFPHLVNAGKYATTFFVVLFSTLYSYSQQWTIELEAGADAEAAPAADSRINVFRSMWIGAMCINSVYTSLWDVLMDWRLFVRDTTDGHVTSVFRRQLLFKRPCYYWMAVVQNVALRFLWPLTVALGSKGLVISEAVRTALALLELYRRFIWNFFRLEVEQLNYDSDQDVRSVTFDLNVGMNSAPPTAATDDKRSTSGRTPSRPSLSRDQSCKSFGDETTINRNAASSKTSLFTDVDPFILRAQFE